MIFISHAWENGQPSPKVLQFVEFLRQSGYEAVCDIMIQQEKTAIHFTEMMAESLRKAEKIIIVLSENYKARADEFTGGVGVEYRYIIDDFSKNENRYILVSFEGRNSNKVPDFLSGRDIVDLSEDEKIDYRELFSKLSGLPKIEFSPVAKVKRVPTPEKIEVFSSGKNYISDELGLDFNSKKLKSDLEKKKALRTVFEKMNVLLNSISNEFCDKNQYFQIECDQIDSVTWVYEMYKNGQKVHSSQIWFGNMMGARSFNIFIGDNIGSKSSFSEMIGIKDSDEKLSLELSFNLMQSQTDGTIESVVKYVWERYFQMYLK